MCGPYLNFDSNKTAFVERERKKNQGNLNADQVAYGIKELLFSFTCVEVVFILRGGHFVLEIYAEELIDEIV